MSFLDLDEYVAEPFSIDATGRELGKSAVVPLLDSFYQAINCISMHNTVGQMVPINNSSWKDWVPVNFRVTLSSLKTFTVVSGLSVNNIASDTVCILLQLFDYSLSPDRSKKVMASTPWPPWRRTSVDWTSFYPGVMVVSTLLASGRHNPDPLNCNPRWWARQLGIALFFIYQCLFWSRDPKQYKNVLYSKLF